MDSVQIIISPSQGLQGSHYLGGKSYILAFDSCACCHYGEMKFGYVKSLYKPSES